MWEVCGRQKRKIAELKSPTGWFCFVFLLWLCAFNKLRATSFSARSAVQQKLASIKVTPLVFIYLFIYLLHSFKILFRKLLVTERTEPQDLRQRAQLA